MRRRALVLVNRNSRNGAEAVHRALETLAGHGIELLHEQCPEPAELAALIKKHADNIDLVVLGGGDGTVNCAASALIETGLPLGLLPLGTANDLARTLKIPTDLDAAADVIAQGHVREIDVGQVNDRHFFNVASLGLSARLTRALTPEVKKRWGRLGYAIATFRALSAHRPFRAEITLDGKTRRIRTMQISIGNGVFYGGGLQVEENAAIDDGKLDLYSLEVASLWRLALIYPAFRRGRQGIWREVRTLSGGKIEVRTFSQHAINTDGELTTATPAVFSVLPKAAKVFAPGATGAAA